MFELLVPRQPSSSIKCPDCRTPMRSYRCGQFLVEKCMGCQGIWFEETEMGTFKAALKELNLRGVEVEGGRLVLRPGLISLCPSCKTGMDPFRYA